MKRQRVRILQPQNSHQDEGSVQIELGSRQVLGKAIGAKICIVTLIGEVSQDLQTFGICLSCVRPRLVSNLDSSIQRYSHNPPKPQLGDLIEGTLSLEGSGGKTTGGTAAPERGYMHVHHQAKVPPGEVSSADDGHYDEISQPRDMQKDHCRPNKIVREIQCKSSVFSDDSKISWEDTGGSGTETTILTEDGHDRGA